MSFRTSIAGIAVLVVALGGAAASGESHGHGSKAERGTGAGHHDMMQNMMRKHSRMMGGHGSMPMMGDGMGMRRGGGGHDMSMMHSMKDMLDADGNGSVTPDEARAGLQSQLSEFDADGDGTLSLSEFETMHSAIIRETMVDRFQFLDDDGDGQVTANEIVKPADHMERMQTMRQRMMQGRDMPDEPGNGSQEHHGGGMTSDN